MKRLVEEVAINPTFRVFSIRFAVTKSPSFSETKKIYQTTEKANKENVTKPSQWKRTKKMPT